MSDASKIINRSESNNYISGRKIFLLDELTTTSCAELIGNISNMVDELRWTTIDTEHISQITSCVKESFSIVGTFSICSHAVSNWSIVFFTLVFISPLLRKLQLVVVYLQKLVSTLEQVLHHKILLQH